MPVRAHVVVRLGRQCGGRRVNRNVPLARGVPLARTGPIRSTPAQRTPEETAARDLVMTRADGRCEACAVPAGPDGLDWSHRVARSALGAWTASNGLALCRSCHSWAHRFPVAAVAAGLALRSWQDPATEPAWVRPVNGWKPHHDWWLLDPEGLWVSWDGDRPAPLAYPCRAGLDGRGR